MDERVERFVGAGRELWRDNSMFRKVTVGAVSALLLSLAISSVTGGLSSGGSAAGGVVAATAGRMLAGKLGSAAEPGAPQGKPAHPILGGLARVVDTGLNAGSAPEDGGGAQHPVGTAFKGIGAMEMTKHPLLGGLAKAIVAAKNHAGGGQPVIPGMVGAAPASSVPILPLPDDAAGVASVPPTSAPTPSVVTVPQAAMAPTVRGGVDLAGVFMRPGSAPSQSAPTASTTK